ncbi:hypothetical protein [Dactylosporangium cerinum]
MTVYDIAAQLPSIDVLRQRCKALAMLDAILGGDHYTYDPAWGTDQVASMRNGSGEEYDIVFTTDGTFIRGVYHESPMFGYTNGQLWPGLLDGLPDEFNSQVTEPAFSHPDGTLNASFILWRRNDDERWHAGDNIDFSPACDDEVDPDGSWLLDILFDDIAEKYREHADEVYQVALPRPAIDHVVAFLPLTDAVIRALNPEASPAHVRAEAEKLGYPCRQTPATSRTGPRPQPEPPQRAEHQRNPTRTTISHNRRQPEGSRGQNTEILPVVGRRRCCRPQREAPAPLQASKIEKPWCGPCPHHESRDLFEFR